MPNVHNFQIVKVKAISRRHLRYRVPKMTLIEGANGVANKDEFYGKAKSYWTGVKPDLDGMMGGLSQLSPLDVAESRPFLNKLISKHEMETESVVDLGAGIGRVTQKLFLPLFKEVRGEKIAKKF